MKNFEFKEIVDGWDYDYIGKEENIEILENLIMSASFLDIKPLIDLLAAKIAHKIKTVMGHDRIIVLEDGELVESGKPEELIAKKKGLFYELYKQSKV